MSIADSSSVPDKVVVALLTAMGRFRSIPASGNWDKKEFNSIPLAVIIVSQVLSTKLLLPSTSILPFPIFNSVSSNRILFLAKTIFPCPLMVSPKVLASAIRHCKSI